MASDLNVVALTGRLTRPAEIRYSQNGGTPAVRFSIAVNRTKRNPDGSYGEEANFFDCVYFTRTADSLGQYLDKGRQVAVQGELRQNRWEQDGQTRSRFEINVRDLTLLSSSQNSGSGRSQQPAQSNYASYQPRTQQQPKQQMPDRLGPEAFQDDDIPF